MSMCKVDKYWHIRINMPGMSLWGRYQRMPWQKCTDQFSVPWAESVSSWWLKLLSKFWFIVCYIYGEKTLLSTKHCITGLTLKMTRLCDKKLLTLHCWVIMELGQSSGLDFDLGPELDNNLNVYFISLYVSTTVFG